MFHADDLGVFLGAAFFRVKISYVHLIMKNLTMRTKFAEFHSVDAASYQMHRVHEALPTMAGGVGCLFAVIGALYYRGPHVRRLETLVFYIITSENIWL